MAFVGAGLIRAVGCFDYQKMGTSFVEYGGRGFWSWDGYLEHVLFLLAEAIGPSPHESWLNEVRDHWTEQASGVFSAWIQPKLDEYISSEERKNVILRLIDDVQSRADVTPEAVATAGFMRRLILGEIKTDEASPLDYVVSGEHPYEWWVRRNAERESN
jgi:hypothetical protein